MKKKTYFNFGLFISESQIKNKIKKILEKFQYKGNKSKTNNKRIQN